LQLLTGTEDSYKTMPALKRYIKNEYKNGPIKQIHTSNSSIISNIMTQTTATKT